MNDREIRSYNILKRFKIVAILNKMTLVKDLGFKGTIRKINEKLFSKKVTRENSVSNSSIEVEESKNNNLKVDVKNLKNKIIVIYEKDKPNLIKEDFSLIKITDKPKNKNEITLNQLNTYFQNITLIIFSNSLLNVNINSYFHAKNEKELNKILSVEINKLLLKANYFPEYDISVKASTFFDYKGENYYSGGAERYLLDLHKVCSNLGSNLNIYQNAEKPFLRKYKNVNVIGLSQNSNNLSYNCEYLKQQSSSFKKVCELNNSQLNIYSSFIEAYYNHCYPSVGISHGVFWDHKSVRKSDALTFWAEKGPIIDNALGCDELVSVDTNTANWFQTIDYELGNQKCKVIPNYVDEKEFFPKNKNLSEKSSNNIVITYPRRLYEPRGLYLLLDISEKLLVKHENVLINFVGKGFEDDLKNIRRLIEKFPTRVKCYSMEPNDMHLVYKETDISLIPTLFSEGTSLSCLEAMASGNIVVSTRIGGLTDLILDNHNGFLIEPKSEKLFEKLDYIINNYEQMGEIRENTVRSAKAFSKTIWEKKWSEIIEKYIKKKTNNPELVEFIVDDIRKSSDSILNNIEKELKLGNLIYIRTKKKMNFNSTGLIQFIDFDSDSVSEPVRIYNDFNLKKQDKF